jgi:hypothetical protein
MERCSAANDDTQGLARAQVALCVVMALTMLFINRVLRLPFVCACRRKTEIRISERCL